MAQAAGAVNTIAIRDGKWIGSNTDADGFLEPLRARGVQTNGLRATILGAGGSARGVGLALQREGARVSMAARRGDEAARVAAAVGGTATTWPPPPQSWDLLVNATPVGSRAVGGSPFDGPFDGQLVYDLIYDPDPTPLMRAAAQAGVPAIGGLAMLVAQAERQFEIWTGQRPPAGLFAHSARAAIEARDPNGVQRAATGERDRLSESGAGGRRE
jgi:shikimate dehydrogenase